MNKSIFRISVLLFSMSYFDVSATSDQLLAKLAGMRYEENKSLAEVKVLQTLIEIRGDLSEKMKKANAKDQKLYEGLIERINVQLEGKLSSKVGQAFVEGFAGKAFEGKAIRDWREAVAVAGSFCLAEAAGKTVKKKVTESTDYVFGGLWDYCLGSFMDLCSDLGSMLFHGGHDPFKQEDLRHWGILVQGCFKNVEKVTKNGLKDSSRGRDMTFRPTGDNDDDTELEQDDADAKMTAWKLLIRGYADQLDHVISNIDTRINYYENNSEEVFYANQIKTRLFEFRNMLLGSASIKEFDDFIESNKSFIPALRDNVMSLFTHLANKVTPRSYSLEKGGKSSDKSLWSSNDDEEEDDDTFGSFRRW